MIIMRGQKDFQRVKKIGKSWVHTLIVLQIASNSLPYSRVGYVASKHIGNAVKRNRAKRLLRESLSLQERFISPGWDLLLIARPAIYSCKMNDVLLAVNSLISKANLLKNS
ncbi:MAG TPA: ribonuclease P protein component [Chloroflexi bacterium]|mgnify:FL=1|nr:ribonuclease P protein component [Chloroflexota bacterium]|tara:strand:- start:1602 stop:1934 length:333 start_codon:yes stop_codon:yes gene_type:complete